MSARGVGKIAVALALAWALLAPVGAAAATTCDYDGSEFFTVRMTAPNDSAILSLSGGSNIVVNSGSEGLISCSGGTATLTNTDFIRVLEEGGGSETTVSIHNAPEFASGPEIILANASGTNTLQVFGASAPVHFVMGAQGIDADGDGSKDISFFAVPETIALLATAGADTISARGNAGTGAAFSASFLELKGGGRATTHSKAAKWATSSKGKKAKTPCGASVATIALSAIRPAMTPTTVSTAAPGRTPTACPSTPSTR